MGTVLSAINQGSVIVGGTATAATWFRVFFNYLVPFIVSNVGFVSATLARGGTVTSVQLEVEPTSFEARIVN